MRRAAVLVVALMVVVVSVSAHGATVPPGARSLFIKIGDIMHVDVMSVTPALDKVCTVKAVTVSLSAASVERLTKQVKRGDTFTAVQFGDTELPSTYLLEKVTVRQLSATRNGGRMALAYEGCRERR